MVFSRSAVSESGARRRPHTRLPRPSLLYVSVTYRRVQNYTEKIFMTHMMMMV